MIKKTSVILSLLLSLTLCAFASESREFNWYDAGKYVQHLIPKSPDQHQVVVSEIKTIGQDHHKDKPRAHDQDTKNTTTASGADIIPDDQNR
ncbi:MAG: hypothetical protein HQM16_16155 [Deltaproteobacteria bacterium]|nr:hypothetical protein [Deltaproteobacteria bacterium]